MNDTTLTAIVLAGILVHAALPYVLARHVYRHGLKLGIAIGWRQCREARRRHWEQLGADDVQLPNAIAERLHERRQQGFPQA